MFVYLPIVISILKLQVAIILEPSVNKYTTVAVPIPNSAPGACVLISNVTLPDASETVGSVQEMLRVKVPISTEATISDGHPDISGGFVSTGCKRMKLAFAL